MPLYDYIPSKKSKIQSIKIIFLFIWMFIVYVYVLTEQEIKFKWKEFRNKGKDPNDF